MTRGFGHAADINSADRVLEVLNTCELIVLVWTSEDSEPTWRSGDRLRAS